MLYPVLNVSHKLDEELLGKADRLSVCGQLSLQIADGLSPADTLILLKRHSCRVHLAGNNSEDTVLDWLDAGAVHVVLPNRRPPSWSVVPQNRLLERWTFSEDELSHVKKNATGQQEVIVVFPPGQKLSVEAVQKMLSALPQGCQLSVRAEVSSYNQAAEIYRSGVHLEIAGEDVEDSGCLSFATLLGTILQSDRPDGLISTLVVDEHQVALGLVYSSKESICEAVRLRRGVYQSRKRGLWYKGESSGDTQELLRIDVDCDSDCLRFVVRQRGDGFCHLKRYSCFSPRSGLPALLDTLKSRQQSAPEGSYTKRLFSDKKLLDAKLLEEAGELAEAEKSEDVAWEAADLLYFTLVKCVQSGVSLQDVEAVLDQRARKVRRRRGDAKPNKAVEPASPKKDTSTPAEPGKVVFSKLRTFDYAELSESQRAKLCMRPAVMETDKLMAIVQPILTDVRCRGDAALLELTAKFDCVQLKNPVMAVPPLEGIVLPDDVRDAIEVAYSNVHKFHAAQLHEPLEVETCPGVRCSRFARPIEKVGLYVPGGSAVLPSTALMLAVPAKVAGCKDIILATPPRQDGSISPEVLYIAARAGVQKIVLAGGAQAIAALAYGTESVLKVDKICGPGNSFVTMAKMLVQNDSAAQVSIDMPAGPSEVMVVADGQASAEFVAADLLSQAEHGPDSQVVLVAVSLSEKQLEAVQNELLAQLKALPRAVVTSVALSKSFAVCVSGMTEALEFSNRYAPEHLILNVENAASYLPNVQHAGSVFLGPYSPESCGDYASGTNHTLPTYGYARMYSGVNTATFQKQITAQELSKEGLANIGPAVATLAAVEGLDAHRNAILVRQKHLQQS